MKSFTINGVISSYDYLTNSVNGNTRAVLTIINALDDKTMKAQVTASSCASALKFREYCESGELLTISGYITKVGKYVIVSLKPFKTLSDMTLEELSTLKIKLLLNSCSLRAMRESDEYQAINAEIERRR